jgi:hypothetical protein
MMSVPLFTGNLPRFAERRKVLVIDLVVMRPRAPAIC